MLSSLTRGGGGQRILVVRTIISVALVNMQPTHINYERDIQLRGLKSAESTKRTHACDRYSTGHY